MAFKGGFGIYFTLTDFRVLLSLQYSLFDISVECNEDSNCSGKSPRTKCDKNANSCGKFLSHQLQTKGSLECWHMPQNLDGSTLWKVKLKKVSSKFSVECNSSGDCSGTKSLCSPSKTCGECEQSLSKTEYLKIEFGQTKGQCLILYTDHNIARQFYATSYIVSVTEKLYVLKLLFRHFR